MTITGLDGRFQRVNLRFAQMVGRERHELVGVAVRAITHPDDADDDIDALARMAAGEQDFYRAEKRYVRPDGSIVWTQLEVTLVYEDDAPLHFLSQMIDISDRKAFEEALATSEERFRSLSAAAPNGIYALDLRGALLYANDRLVELTGLSHEQLAGTGWLDMLHPDDRGGSSARAGPPRSPAGSRPSSGSCAPTGRALGAHAREPAAGPRRRGGRLRRIARGRHGRARGHARAGRARGGVPDAGRELLGLPRPPRAGWHLPLRLPRLRRASPATRRRSSIGQSPFRLVATEDRDAVRAYARLVSEREEPATAAYRLRCKDGQLRWLESTARAVRDERRRARARVGHARHLRAQAGRAASSPTQALHDALTGLPNRALFLDRLDQALRRTERRSGVGWRCCSSTSTASRSSTTRSATTPATSCCRRRRAARSGAARRRHASRASAATSSRSCCEDIAGERRGRRASPSACVDVFARAVRRSTGGEVFVGAERRHRARAAATDGRAPRTCSATPTPRCTAPRSAAGAATSSSTTAMRARRGARGWRLESALRRALERGELRAALPADRRPRDGRVARLRGAGALGAPRARARAAGRLHPARRGDRADRRRSARGCCARPAGRPRAGAGCRRAAGDVASTSRRASSPSATSSTIVARGAGRDRRRARRRSAWRSPRRAVMESARRRRRCCARSSALGVRLAHRRLRHRLLVAGAPAPLPGRRRSRSTARSSPASAASRRTRRSPRRSSRWRTRSACRRVAEGIETRRAARRAARARLRPRPGLPLRPRRSAGGGRAPARPPVAFRACPTW